MRRILKSIIDYKLSCKNHTHFKPRMWPRVFFFFFFPITVNKRPTYIRNGWKDSPRTNRRSDGVGHLCSLWKAQCLACKQSPACRLPADAENRQATLQAPSEQRSSRLKERFRTTRVREVRGQQQQTLHLILVAQSCHKIPSSVVH